MNVHLTGFRIIKSELYSFYLEQTEALIDFFWNVNLFIASGMTLKIKFSKNYKSTSILSYPRFINYLVFKKVILILDF